MEDQSKEIERLRLQVKNLEKLSSLGMWINYFSMCNYWLL